MDSGQGGALGDWLRRLEGLHPRSIDLGLERVGRVHAALGAPRPARVVTVAGTNGKGSLVALLEAILAAAGYRVGAYTSPHLLRFNERVRIAGAEADDAALCAAFARVEAARGDTSLTYFEFTTLAALLLLAEAPLDVALLEVGLGGRLDAVNLVDPDVAVLTPIDLDHAEWLGNDRDSVGREKAGIMRSG
ncbi:MAG TPA: Mur ligase family protein, partial [Gammaproteobacteria bacterium]